MVTIVSIFESNEDFIKIQLESIKKYVRGNYEYILFNCANTQLQSEKNQKVCEELKIKFINIPMNDVVGDPSLVGGIAFNRSFEYLSEKKVFKIDSDMFFIEEIDINELFDTDLLISPRFHEGEEIAWGGIFGINLKIVKQIIDFRPAVVPRTDAFGSSLYLLRDKNLTVKRLNHLCLERDTAIGTIFQINASGEFLINDSKITEGKFLFEKIFENLRFISGEEIRYEDWKKNILSKLSMLKQKYLSFSPPQPYNVDIINFKEKNFIIHFRSANYNRINELYFEQKKTIFKKII